MHIGLLYDDLIEDPYGSFMNELHQTRYPLLQRACDLHDEQAWEEFVGCYRPFIFYILRQQMGVDRDEFIDANHRFEIMVDGTETGKAGRSPVDRRSSSEVSW